MGSSKDKPPTRNTAKQPASRVSSSRGIATNAVKKEYGFAEAKAHLSAIVDHVEATGEEVVVMRHGKPVVRLVPERGNGPRRLGFARGRVKFLPGWDQPLTVEDLIGE